MCGGGGVEGGVEGGGAPTEGMQRAPCSTQHLRPDNKKPRFLSKIMQSQSKC